MKKSQLRKIIRKIINEQWSLPKCIGRHVAAHKCGTNGSGPGGSFVGGYNYGHPPSCMTIDGQTPQPGDVFKIKSSTPSYDCDTGNPGSGWNYGSNALVGNHYKISYTFPCYEDYVVGTGPNSQPSNEYFDFESVACCGIEGCTDPLATNYNPLAQCDDGSCTYQAFDPITVGVGTTDKCRKCCCKPDEGGQFCIKGTEIFLTPNTNPCKCPPGMVDNLCDKNPR